MDLRIESPFPSEIFGTLIHPKMALVMSPAVSSFHSIEAIIADHQGTVYMCAYMVSVADGVLRGREMPSAWTYHSCARTVLVAQ